MDLEKIKGALHEGLKKNKEDINKSIEEKVNPLNEKIGDMDNRLKKVEETPTKKKDINVNTKFEKKYKGYNLNKQGIALAEKAAKDKSLTTLNDGEKMHNLKKFMVDFVRASFHKDFSKQEGVEAFRKAAMQEDTDSEGGYKWN